MIYIIVAVLLTAGFYLILTQLLQLPDGEIVKAHTALKKRISSWGRSTLDIKLEGIAARISKYIRLRSSKKEEMIEIFAAADIDVSPEMYLSNCLIKAFLVGLLSVPAFLIFPAMGFLIIALSVIVFIVLKKKPYKSAMKKKTNIEAELPGFVNHTAKILKHSRDVLYIIGSYSEYAGSCFKKELLITEADMRSGNYETALTRLESRVGSSMLSDVSRGLIGIIRGDETNDYWTNLEIKFSDYQKQLLRRKALTVPRKVKRLSLLLLLCFILIYVVVMGTIVVNSLQGFI